MKPIVITLLIVVLAAVLLIAFWPDSEETTSGTVAMPDAAAEMQPEPESRSTREQPRSDPDSDEPAFVLPLLQDSDDLVRDGVVSLTRHEGINAWLAENELIRKFVAFIDGVSRGRVAVDLLRSMTPEEPFTARRTSRNTWVMTEESYQRYDRVADILASVDARRTAEFYQLISPLFQTAYEELGYGNTAFDRVVFQAIARLLETPVITDEIKLVRPVVMFQYEDEKLESLSDLQKQMLRMGPRNTRLVQEKLKEVSLELRKVLSEN